MLFFLISLPWKGKKNRFWGLFRIFLKCWSCEIQFFRVPNHGRQDTSIQTTFFMRFYLVYATLKKKKKKKEPLKFIREKKSGENNDYKVTFEDEANFFLGWVDLKKILYVYFFWVHVSGEEIKKIYLIKKFV